LKFAARAGNPKFYAIAPQRYKVRMLAFQYLSSQLTLTKNRCLVECILERL